MSRNIPLILSFLAVGFVFFILPFEISRVQSPISTRFEKVVVNIPKGTSIRGVAALLSEKRLIYSALAFEGLARWKKIRPKAGEYVLSPSMSPETILVQLASGRVILYPVTIPEGLTLKEISYILQSKGLIRPEDFFRAASDPNLLKKFNIEAMTAEGYLFPETYQFRKGVTAREIVVNMLSMYQKKVLPLLEENGGETWMSLHQVTTLASLIEKETSVPEERALVSAVFHNRLDRGMRLQTDPTVIYALPHFDGNIRKADLEIDSPYNTYRYSGLPPGPIANVGLGSMLAALKPARVDFLYFVSKNNGTHHFSSDLEGHQKAVQKYQLNKNG